MQIGACSEADKPEVDKPPPPSCGNNEKRDSKFNLQILDKLHDSTFQQVVFLLLVITVAVVTGVLYEKATALSETSNSDASGIIDRAMIRAQCLLIMNASLLGVLVSVMLLIVHSRRDDNVAITSLFTITLLYSALFSILSSCWLPKIPCQLLAVALSLPYLLICLEQKERTHALFATAIVFPTLLTSNLADGLNPIHRCTLFVPAIVFFQYKQTAFSSRFWKRKAIDDFLEKPLIPLSFMSILVGVTIESLALTFDIQFWQVDLAGFVMFWFGLCLFHYYLQVRGLVENDGDISAEEFTVKKRCGLLWIYFTMIVLMSVVLVIPGNGSALFLFCCLIYLEHLHRPMLHWTANLFNFQMSLCFLITLLVATWLRVPLLKTGDTIIDCHSFPPDLENTTVDRTPWFGYMTLFTLFYYFSMTTLIQSDGRGKQASEKLPVTTKEVHESFTEISVISEKIPAYNANDKECGELPRKAALFLPD